MPSAPCGRLIDILPLPFRGSRVRCRYRARVTRAAQNCQFSKSDVVITDNAKHYSIIPKTMQGGYGVLFTRYGASADTPNRRAHRYCGQRLLRRACVIRRRLTRLVKRILVIAGAPYIFRVCRFAVRQRVSLPIRLYSGACAFGAFGIYQKAHKGTAAAEHTRKGARSDPAFGVDFANFLLLCVGQHSAAVCEPFKRYRLCLCVWFHNVISAAARHGDFLG